MRLDYEDESILRELIAERKRERAVEQWKAMERNHRLGYISNEQHESYMLGESEYPSIRVHVPYPWDMPIVNL